MTATTTPSLVAGRYRLVESLGDGPSGALWCGHDELLDRDVALEAVRVEQALSAAERERLVQRTLREVCAVSVIDTPAAVRVFDLAEHDGCPWIVLELVRGRTLAEAIARQQLTEVDPVQLGCCLFEALEAAHRAGVVHGRVRPDAVLLGRDGRIALGDFGTWQVPEDAPRPSPADDVHAAARTVRAAAAGAVAPDLAQVLEVLTAADAEHRPDAATARQMFLDLQRERRRCPERPAGESGDTDERVWPLVAALVGVVALITLLLSVTLHG